jgi:hypothetical protein
VRSGESGTWADGGKADGQQLLPGEAPTSQMPEDAELWIAVYSELLEFLSRHPKPEPFRRTIARYRGRLTFWQGRLADLSADLEVHGQGSSGSVR